MTTDTGWTQDPRGAARARTGPAAVSASDRSTAPGWLTLTRQACRRCYDALWTLTTGAGCALGLLGAVQAGGLLMVLSAFLAAVILAAMMVLPWCLGLELRVRPVLVGAPVSGLVVVVIWGLLYATGPLSVAVLSMLMVASPYTRDGVLRQIGARAGATRRGTASAGLPRSATEPSTPLPDEPGLSVSPELSLVDLCQAWRSSFVALERAETPQSRLRVVEARAIYLDELERRSGVAMKAWLHSGARAAGDPSRWLSSAEHAGRMRRGSNTGR